MSEQTELVFWPNDPVERFRTVVASSLLLLGLGLGLYGLWIGTWHDRFGAALLVAVVVVVIWARRHPDKAVSVMALLMALVYAPVSPRARKFLKDRYRPHQ